MELAPGQRTTGSRTNKPQPKRRRIEEDALHTEGTKPKARGRKLGKLTSIMTVPIDVLLEIFGHLRPYDLLKLARVTKDFRRVLMSRNSISVWRAARANVPGLPDCPTDMTEPEYANLAFDPRCHYCNTCNVRTVEWHFRTRICGRCAKDVLVETWMGFSFDTYFDEDQAYSPTKRDWQFMLRALIPRRRGKRDCHVYLRSDFLVIKEQFEALKDSDAQYEFVKERIEFITNRAAHARQCEAWAQIQFDDRSTELQALRDERKQAIVEKLISLGWEKELLGIRPPDSLDYLKVVARPQKLTDRIWNTIEPEIVTFIKKMQAKRLAREHAALVIDRKRVAISVLRAFKKARLPHVELMPEPPDFCEFAEVKAILEKPSDVEVTESSFDDIIPTIPELITRWRGDIHLQFIQMHQRPTPVAQRPWLLVKELDNRDDGLLTGSAPTDTSESMKLAATIYTCSECETRRRTDNMHSQPIHTPVILEPLTYPHVLGHSCLTRMEHFGWYPVTDASTQLVNFASHSRKRWSCGLLSRNPNLSRIARMVISKAGQDPDVITSDEMDRLKVKFVCKVEECPDGATGMLGLKAPLLNWRQAVSHYRRWHNYVTELTMRIVDEATIPQIYILPPTAKPAIWCCAHCSDLPSEHDKADLVTIKSHLLSSHKVVEPRVNTDYYRHFSNSKYIVDPDVRGGTYLFLP